jgi:protoporphyrinogen oxidase
MGSIRRASKIRFARARRISHAYVVYDHNYSKTVPEVLDWLSRHHIFAAGRYARWEYASMEDALIQGFDAADSAKELS